MVIAICLDGRTDRPTEQFEKTDRSSSFHV